MRGRGLWGALVVAATVSAVACAEPRVITSTERTPGVTAAPVAVVTSTTTPLPTTTAVPGSITLAFAGDVALISSTRGLVERDPAALLVPVAPILSAADLAVVNLETAVTTRGAPVADKTYTFRAPPAVMRALRAGGVDVASMANNHGLDYGAVGVDDALAASRETGLPVVGIGRNATEAYAPFVATIRGQRVGVIGATQVIDADLVEDWTATDSHPGLASAKDVERLVAAVAAARANVETLIVFLHWGVEQDVCPTGAQRGLARRLVDAGADVVVGGHAHRLQGAGRLGDAFVAYGLGNFAFGTISDEAAKSGVLVVTVSGRHTDQYRWVPALIRGGRPFPLTEPEATPAQAEWQSLRDCTGLAA